MLTKTKRQLPIKEKPLLLISAVFFILTFVARIFIAGQSAAKNVELKDLFVQKQNLSQQVARLKYDDLKLSSIDAIEDKAKLAGFVPMTQTLLSLDITVSTPLASANSTR